MDEKNKQTKQSDKTNFEQISSLKNVMIEKSEQN